MESLYASYLGSLNIPSIFEPGSDVPFVVWTVILLFEFVVNFC